MAASLHLCFLLETILFSRWIHVALSDIGLLVCYSGILKSAEGWPRTLAALRPWQQTRRLVMLPFILHAVFPSLAVASVVHCNGRGRRERAGARGNP